MSFFWFKKAEDESLGTNCENFAHKEIQDVVIVHGKKYADFELFTPPVNLCVAPPTFYNAQQERKNYRKQVPFS